jgi:DNA invertase Pin-like site-specific DNA recombinase
MKSIPFSTGDLVAGYFRDSGGDEQDLSVDRQIAEFRRWLTEHQLQEGQLFADRAKPGSTMIGRQDFQAMMRHFRSGQAEEKGVVVWRSNRFGRNVNDNQFNKADLRRRGYILHSLTDNIPSDQYGQHIEYLLDWKDEQFLEALSEDVISGLRHIVETYGAVVIAGDIST